MKLHESGLPTSRIGLTLRDQYGVPSTKLALGKNITSFLKENKVLPDIPEDLTNLIEKLCTYANTSRPTRRTFITRDPCTSPRTRSEDW